MALHFSLGPTDMREELIERLRELDTVELETALAYALYMNRYGVDITEKHDTAVQNMAFADRIKRQCYVEMEEFRKESTNEL